MADNKTGQRVALVTGGNRGIGFAICRELAKRDYRVILAARDREAMEQARSELAGEGLKVDGIELDVTDPRMVEITQGENVNGSFIGDWIRRRHGRLDVLINNAGVVPDKARHDEQDSILDTSREAFELGFATHLYGPLALARAAIELMHENNYGRIVNMSTGMARLTDMSTGWPAYRISKLALNGLTRILAAELAGTNIKVNAASPGWVRTRMGGEQAELSVEQGIDTPVWLATLPDDGPSGGFFANREPSAW